MRNMLSNSSISLSQQLAERFRKTALFSFLISAFISFQYLGNKKDQKKFLFFFVQRHLGKGYALAPSVCRNSHSWIVFFKKEEIDYVRNYDVSPFYYI